MSNEVNHSFEWSGIVILVVTAIAGAISSAAAAVFNLFIRSRDNKMAEMIKKAIDEVIKRADERYVSSQACDAAHKLTDQTLMTLRDDFKAMKQEHSAQYTELKSMLTLILDKLIE